jgi:hypothetical protein
MAQPIDNGHSLGAGPVEGRYRAQRVGSVVVIEHDEGPSPAETIARSYLPKGYGGT